MLININGNDYTVCDSIKDLMPVRIYKMNEIVKDALAGMSDTSAGMAGIVDLISSEKAMVLVRQMILNDNDSQVMKDLMHDKGGEKIDELLAFFLKELLPQIMERITRILGNQLSEAKMN